VYTWTDEKNQLNKKNHGLFLYEITDVFNDPPLVEFYDKTHSTVDEERYICLGRWHDVLILSVVYTERNGDTHLITARKATAKERRAYEENYRRETS